jgi:hypothetical protein
MTARTAYALLRPMARAMKWGPLLVAAGVGLAVVAIPAILSVGLTAAHLTTLLRIAAACGALGLAFLLDDAATRTTATVPTSRLIRHAVRAGIALPAIGIWWATTLTVATIGVKPAVAASLPGAALTLEAAALVAAAFLLAASGLRFTTDGSGGTLAAPALLILLAVVWFMPHRVALILAPADPLWVAAHHRWAVLLIAAVAGFVWASRDSSPRGKRVRLIPRPR